MKGAPAPWRKVTVESPVKGAIAGVRLRIGQEVEKGGSLVTLDLAQARARYRRKRLDLSRAPKQLEVLEHRERSAEMSAARPAGGMSGWRCCG